MGHTECRKRILIMTPYYMTIAFYLMLGVPLTKNYIYLLHEKNGGLVTALYTTIMITFPFIFIVLFRYLLIRRARSVEIIKLKRQKEEKEKKKTMGELYGSRTTTYMQVL